MIKVSIYTLPMRKWQRVLGSFIALVASLVFSAGAHSACDCGSTDSSAPCDGETIDVVVGDNGVFSRTISVSWSFSSGGNPLDVVSLQMVIIGLHLLWVSLL